MQIPQEKYSDIYPTRCNVTQFILFGKCSTCFGWYHYPSSGAQTTVSTASGCGRSGWPDHDQQHCYHHAPKVKPEAATAVVVLLMMGVRTPETC